MKTETRGSIEENPSPSFFFFWGRKWEDVQNRWNKRDLNEWKEKNKGLIYFKKKKHGPSFNIKHLTIFAWVFFFELKQKEIVFKPVTGTRGMIAVFIRVLPQLISHPTTIQHLSYTILVMAGPVQYGPIQIHNLQSDLCIYPGWVTAVYVDTYWNADGRCQSPFAFPSLPERDTDCDRTPF